MPTRGLSEPSEFFGRVAQISDPELAARAKTLFDRFTNYQIAVVTLRGMSVDEVAKVFERINSTHTPLTVVDLIRAATWTPEFDLQDEIDTLLTVLDRKKYGRVDSKPMLRTIAASAGFGFARDDMQRLRELSPEELQNAVAQPSRRGGEAGGGLPHHRDRHPTGERPTVLEPVRGACGYLPPGDQAGVGAAQGDQALVLADSEWRVLQGMERPADG